MRHQLLYVVLLVVISITVTPWLSGLSAAEHSLASQGYYTLNFLANREAVVYARLVISNNETKPLTSITVQLPAGEVRDMAIFQQALPKKCLSYVTYPGGFSCGSLTDAEFKDFIEYPKGILWTQQPFYTASYLKAAYTREGNIYTVTFPLPVKQYKATGLVISYIAKGYTREPFPGYTTYSFTTFKVPAIFHTERVAIDVDNDVNLFIYDERTQRIMNRSVITGYANEYYPAGGKVPISTLDRLIIAAGLSGAKTAKSQVLLSNETYTVTGEYGTGETLLHYAPLVKHLNSILAGFAALLASMYLLRRFRKKHRQ